MALAGVARIAILACISGVDYFFGGKDLPYEDCLAEPLMTGREPWAAGEKDSVNVHFGAARFGCNPIMRETDRQANHQAGARHAPVDDRTGDRRLRRAS
jgi:hypothetical protein